MKIPFNIKYREEIESGKYKVYAEDGNPVRIICWDAKNYWDTPIIGLYNNGEVDVVIEYNIHGASGNNATSLWIETGESEDERIRKAIMGLTYIDGIEPILTKCSITAQDIRKYLEKQKERVPENAETGTQEQKPVEIHIDNPNIQKVDPDIKIETRTDGTGDLDGKALLYTADKSYKIGFRDGVASVKPAEWSEEDEK